MATPASIRECTVDLKWLRVGEPVPTVPRERLPAKVQHTNLKASAIVAGLDKKLWHKVPLPCTPGIVHFNNASFIFISLHKVNIGAKDYGKTYQDGFGLSETGKPGPYLLWAGQDSFNASAPVHQPLWEAGSRQTYLFVRNGQVAPFVFWGRLLNAKLLKDGTPLRARFTIEDFDRLKRMRFPGREPQPNAQGQASAASSRVGLVKSEQPPSPPPRSGRASGKRPADDGIGARDASQPTTRPPLPAPPQDPSRSSARFHSHDETLAVNDRCKGKWVTENGKAGRECAGWHVGTVTAVHTGEGGRVVGYDIEYDDGDVGRSARPELLQRLATELSWPARKAARHEPFTASTADEPCTASTPSSADASAPSSSSSYADDGSTVKAEEPPSIVPAVKAEEPPSIVPAASAPAASSAGVAASQSSVASAPQPADASPARGSSRLRQQAADQHEECVICMDSKRSHLFIPCGHRVACERCAAMVSVCPICRETAIGTQRVYL